jgi:hypothetical protein
MSADRDELERLVHEIPEDEVPQALAEMRRHLRPVGHRPWPPTWFGSAPGDGTSVGANADEHLSFLASGQGR